MNVTELSRKLKITTSQLYDHLPKMGFDIGRRAIKIDNAVAMKVLKQWSAYQAALKKELEEEKKSTESETAQPQEKQTIRLPLVITVREFAEKTNLPVTKVMQTLMNNGILTAMNEKIDYETAAILAEDLGFKVEKESADTDTSALFAHDVIEQAIKEEDPTQLLPRPPIVVVMGHVDHGKTSLLDAIRKTNVIASESGGITQHIGAYQAKKTLQKTGEERVLTFIDTPGHEAFTTMRSRGAKVADIAILVVAADDGMRPQTEEAVKIIKAAGLPLVVAINKIDKPGANIEKVKRELSDIGLIPEDWGGSTTCVPISAKERVGIDDLLEMTALVADLHKDTIVANPNGKTLATVIESHIDKNEGVVATLLVQNGTLHVNDFLVIDNMLYGKARSLRDYTNTAIVRVAPSQPVKIIGLKAAPLVGSVAIATKTAPRDIEIATKRMETRHAVVTPKQGERKEGVASVNIILKTDTLGSLEAIATALIALSHPEVRLSIVSKELGTVTTADVLTAEATNGFIAGFHVPVSTSAAEIAAEKNVTIKTYKIIYELLDDVKKMMEILIKPETHRIIVGKAKILAIFRTETKSMIVGAVVLDGTIKQKTRAIIKRGENEIGDGLIAKVRSGKTEIASAQSGQECGLAFEGKHQLEVGDILHLYEEETVKRSLASYDQ